MEGRPSNLAEWANYISGLSGHPLFSQAVAANTVGFGRQLVAEGMSMWEVQQLMLLFVRQLRATGTKVPGGGAWNLVNMALTDPIARKGPTMSEEEAELLETSYEPAMSDDLYQFELEAEFEADY
jgi:hypothetical protein